MNQEGNQFAAGDEYLIGEIGRKTLDLAVLINQNRALQEELEMKTKLIEELSEGRSDKS